MDHSLHNWNLAEASCNSPVFSVLLHLCNHIGITLKSATPLRAWLCQDKTHISDISKPAKLSTLSFFGGAIPRNSNLRDPKAILFCRILEAFRKLQESQCFVFPAGSPHIKGSTPPHASSKSVDGRPGHIEWKKYIEIWSNLTLFFLHTAWHQEVTATDGLSLPVCRNSSGSQNLSNWSGFARPDGPTMTQKLSSTTVHGSTFWDCKVWSGLAFQRIFSRLLASLLTVRSRLAVTRCVVSQVQCCEKSAVNWRLLLFGSILLRSFKELHSVVLGGSSS